MLHVFMSLSVECKLKTWKTTIGKKKEIKSETQRCALSEKRNFSGPSKTTTVAASAVKLFSSFALFLTLPYVWVFPPQKSTTTKEMEERRWIKKTSLRSTLKLLSRRESFSRVSFGLIAITLIDLREAFEQLRKSREIQIAVNPIKLAQKVIDLIVQRKKRGVKVRLQQFSSLLFLDQERRWRNF